MQRCLVTTPELLRRVPVDELPALKHIFLVGENIEEDGKVIDFNKRLMKLIKIWKLNG